MAKKIIISYLHRVAAIIEKNKVREIMIINTNYQINDIYIGFVQKIFSSINAAFIKLGNHSKNGFIHISDINILKHNQKLYCINDILSIKQLILVQVIKEPTLNKGPRLTTNIHLHGRYLILMPFSNIILISHKINNNNQRIYLYSLAILIKPKQIGLLIKASAEGILVPIILKELDFLVNQWSFIQKIVIIAHLPCLVYKDEDLVKKILRDFYNKDIEKIIIDSEMGIKLVYYYLKKWSYLSSFIKTKVQFYNKKLCILDQFRIKQTIKDSLISKVNLFYEGSLFIENYEALTIIDVNSGSFNQANNSKETILRINLYAAIEISYQLQIRNINGIIIIDFINMYSQADKLQLFKHLTLLLKPDKCKPQILQLSELGLLELTRRRISQSLQEIFNYIKLFNFKIYIKYLNQYYLVNRNINSLYFSKKFYCNLILENKCFTENIFIYNKYYNLIDNDNIIYFFFLKRTYLIPLIY
uniref:Ribonuclease E n=1 Tax=Harveyella mirabilis TaxID=282355 RepID=A0A3S8UW42_9FLOR|nr:ribonuclease E [Harveyella mirabilis]